MSELSKIPSWNRPEGSFHAHFDCFSGAAGDMMLAACLDSTDESDRLLAYIQHCIEEGMPELKGEFTIHQKRVWRSEMGSIAANYVQVQSKYHHESAPVPKQPRATVEHEQVETHDHGHSHERSPEHDHSHTHHPTTHDHSHDHWNADSSKHPNQQSQNKTVESHEHSHSHYEETTSENTHHEHAHKHSSGTKTVQTHANKHSSGTKTVQTHTHAHSKSSHSHSHASLDSDVPLRNLPQIQTLLENAPTDLIPAWVKSTAILAFTALAEAEALTHGAASKDDVHFHEVGAIDSIVDTVGTLMALHCLSVSTVSCSRLPLGEGTVWTDHGLLPVPAPATLRLLVGMPTCPGPPGITGELVTPTAAALLKVLTVSQQSSSSGRAPCFTIQHVGIGAGTKDFCKHPNVLRVLIGNQIVKESFSTNQMMLANENGGDEST